MPRKYVRRTPGFVSPFKGVSPKGERNDHIVRLAESGVYSLEQLGRMFDISRERIRQIYTRKTGKPFSIHNEVRRSLRQALINRRMNKALGVTCVRCKKQITRKDLSNAAKKESKKAAYCIDCREIAKKDGRDYSRSFICDNCGTVYHPHRNYDSASRASKRKIKGKFCKIACYWGRLKRVVKKVS